jgi:hypothetical protein
LINQAIRTGFGDWLSQFPSPRRFGFTRRDAMTCSEIRLAEQAYAAGLRRGYVLAFDQQQEPEHGQSASV